MTLHKIPPRVDGDDSGDLEEPRRRAT